MVRTGRPALLFRKPFCTAALARRGMPARHPASAGDHEHVLQLPVAVASSFHREGARLRSQALSGTSAWLS